MFLTRRIGRGFESMELRAAPSSLGLGDLWNGDSGDDNETQFTNVFTFVDESGEVIAPEDRQDKGLAKLERNDDGVELNIWTTHLPAGAYTVWWVVFNNPDACVDGCDGADLGNPAVEGSVLYATGGVVGASGFGYFRADLEVGETEGEVLFGPGLLDAGTEIHFVIRNHGPASSDPDELEAQTTTFEGGCDVFDCYDPQAGIFL